MTALLYMISVSNSYFNLVLDKVCKRAVTLSSDAKCPLCLSKITPADCEKTYDLLYKIDDGAQFVWASAVPAVHSTIIQYDPKSFEILADEVKANKLNLLKGQEFLFLVIRVSIDL